MRFRQTFSIQKTRNISNPHNINKPTISTNLNNNLKSNRNLSQIAPPSPKIAYNSQNQRSTSLINRSKILKASVPLTASTPKNTNFNKTSDNFRSSSNSNNFNMTASNFRRNCDENHNNYLDQYEIIKELGRGTYGLVHLAKQKTK